MPNTQTYADRPTLALLNSLIDGAVPIKKLTDITTTADAINFSFNMTGNTWENYNFIVLRFTPVGGSGAACNIRLNGNMGFANHYALGGNTSNAYDLIHFPWMYGTLMLFFTGKGTVPGLLGLGTGDYELFYCRSTLRPSQITTMLFGISTSEIFCKAGSRLEIWGIL